MAVLAHFKPLNVNEIEERLESRRRVR